MATPHVAAVAALYFSAKPGSGPTLCETKLFSTAIDLGNPGNDWKYGYGLVNAYGAVKNIRSSEYNHLQLRFLPRLKQLFMNMRLLL
jgi:subtilisin family serine protease